MAKPFRFTLSGFLALFLTLLMACEDKVREFDGFNQKELEYLLGSNTAKVWQRTERLEDDVEVVLEGCAQDNYIIFVADSTSTGVPQPLLYGYNPATCDSLDFCALNPDFCQSHVDNCAANPGVCELLEDGLLFIGTWYAKAPFVTNTRTDTLVFTINKKAESVQVTSITAGEFSIFYKSRKSASGVSINETYVNVTPENP